MEFALIPIMGFLNRLRGGGWFPYNKDVFWLLFAIVIYTYTQSPLVTATVILGSFLDFRLSWGWLLNLNKGSDGGGWRDPNDKRWKIPYVRFIRWLTNDDDYLGMFVRRLFIFPMFVGLYFLGYLNHWEALAGTVVHAALMVLGYHLGAMYDKKDSIRGGEIVSGAFFGTILAVVLF